MGADMNMAGNIMVRCPDCGSEITLDRLHPLAAQVRDAEFKRDLAEAMAAEREKARAEADGLRRELEERNREIGYLRDMRTRLSTKMLGESLERHCADEFDKVRSIAFPLAEFHKDNDASSGSKGDYIFRDFGPDGTEITSIMFEMKNEDPGTRTRHKNADFFAELDKDRREKGCTWAVLVSLLEPDNDFYNAGIADVSWRYPRMLVIRPQCFITVIGLLRNAGMEALEYRRQAEEARAQQSALDEIEGRVDVFKTGFLKNCAAGDAKLADAVTGINQAISRLEKIRDGLEQAQRQYGLAAKKADGLTAKKIIGKTKIPEGDETT